MVSKGDAHERDMNGRSMRHTQTSVALVTRMFKLDVGMPRTSEMTFLISSRSLSGLSRISTVAGAAVVVTAGVDWMGPVGADVGQILKIAVSRFAW